LKAKAQGELEMRYLSLLIVFLIISCSCDASPVSIGQQNAQLVRLRNLLAIPEEKTDLLHAKLIIDSMIDPSIDIPEVKREVDELASQIKTLFPVNATQKIKLEIIIVSLSRPGPWNKHRPFSYDLDDPFGKVISNKLLATYLATRKGNCVSMPILVAILGQKLGLEVTLSTAPEHIFAKFRNDQGQWVNIEATSFGYKTDTSYRQDMRISQKAMTSGIYLGTLTKRESVTVMLGTLMEFWGKQGINDSRILLADKMLQVYPKNVSVMLQKGNAYFQISKEKYLMKYQSLDQMTSEQREEFQMLKSNNKLWFDKAEALGWAQLSQAQNIEYKKSIQGIKLNR
jgi:regulator of sirC expression with transglutaminase-like and TPR domain